MIISILTLFPEIFDPVFSSSILGRAQKNNLLRINLVNIRDFGLGKHHQVDDKPYGGGVGMLMRVDVVRAAIENAKIPKCKKEKVILLDPKGAKFDQPKARSFSKLDHLILICGHYEGIDERISGFVDGKISIGDYVLTGGEIPAMVVADAVARLIPGVLSKKEATLDESFSKEGYLEAPHYTRPPVYRGRKVPPVLLSGNHQKIADWEIKQRIKLSK